MGIKNLSSSSADRQDYVLERHRFQEWNYYFHDQMPGFGSRKLGERTPAPDIERKDCELELYGGMGRATLSQPGFQNMSRSIRTTSVSKRLGTLVCRGTVVKAAGILSSFKNFPNSIPMYSSNIRKIFADVQPGAGIKWFRFDLIYRSYIPIT